MVIVILALLLVGCTTEKFINDGRRYVGYVYNENTSSCEREESDNIRDPYKYRTIDECNQAYNLL
ncbi:MAG: hypothetical protein Q8L34_03620 [Candidatus Woesearchaeota archaeon]|nr:hypothetical protein [Candidatus Woesearchaeota archaeon]